MRKERVLLRSLGEKIKILRKERNITQKDLANKLNVSLDTIKNWEQGYNYPSIDLLLTIAKYFKCDFDYLLGHQDTPNKEYKHFSEYTGLSTESIRTLLYFCQKDSILPDILEDIDLLFFIEHVINSNYDDTEIIIKGAKWNSPYQEQAQLDKKVLYQADKLDLYYELLNFINKAREKRGFETI